MDINMPEMDGLESARLINQDFRENRIGSKPYISAITAYTSEEMMRKAKMNGMDKFLTKPAEIRIIFQLLSSIMDKRDAGGQ